MQDLPKLKTINLSSNLIKSIEIEFMCAKKRLMIIDISKNQIKFSSGEEFRKWILYMKSMEVLEIFNIESNPFFLKFPRVKVNLFLTQLKIVILIIYHIKDILIRELGDRIKKINNTVCDREYVTLKKDTSLPPLDYLSLNSTTSIKEENHFYDDRLVLNLLIYMIIKKKEKYQLWMS